MSLVSVSILKEYLPEIQGNSIDADLSSLISRVESYIARYLGFPLADSATSYGLDQSTYTIFADRPMYNLPYVLQSPLKPIVSITSIHSDVDREYGSDSLIDSSKYEIDKQNGRVILDDTSPDTFDVGFRAIKIVGTFGYNTSSPPDDLVHAICVYCSHLQRAKSSQGNNSITQRNSTVSLSPRTMPDEVKEILRGYRNVSVIF
jgi:hypothetical protein